MPQNNLAQACLHTGSHTMPHTEEMLKSPNYSIPFTVSSNLQCVTGDTVLGAVDSRGLDETRRWPARVHAGKGDRWGHEEFYDETVCNKYKSGRKTKTLCVPIIYIITGVSV